jgi:ubiquitin carboxyl-terminal hydrolase L3
MDGRKPFPINHGKSGDLLVDAVKVVKGFMEREPGEWSIGIGRKKKLNASS